MTINEIKGRIFILANATDENLDYLACMIRKSAQLHGADTEFDLGAVKTIAKLRKARETQGKIF